MSLALVAFLLAQTTPSASRFDTGERLKVMEVAWMSETKPAKRQEAVKKLSDSIAAFFGGQFSVACRSLDAATAILQDRKLIPEDAVSVRFEKPLIDTDGKAVLRCYWSYKPENPSEIEIEAGKTKRLLKPGESMDIEIPVDDLKSSQDSGDEFGMLVAVKVGSLTKTATISVVKNSDSRIKKLTESKDTVVKGLGEFAASAANGGVETDPLLIDDIFLAEGLEDGSRKLADVHELPYIKHEGFVMRAAFPEKLSKDPTVVIAYHGAGGSENMMFEAYGRGIVVSEALKRGWIVIAPRAAAGAGQACLEWLRTVRKIEPTNVLVLGHSMGGGLSLSSASMNPKAIALFAPAASQVPPALSNTPIFLAVGKNEMSMLVSLADKLKEGLKGKSNSEAKTYPDCEHLMIVAEAAKDAFSFFDKVLEAR